MRRRPWSPEEDAAMRARYPHEYSAGLARDLGRSLYSVFNRAKALGLMKSEAFHQSDRSGRIQKGRTDPRMIATQLKPGNQPWNKGAKGSTGIHPNCRATQFKKGEVQGRAAALVQPIGAERVSKDGILQRKVNNELPFQRRWRSVHSLVWEAAHGPIPQGHKVVFLPGQFTNVAAQITPEAEVTPAVLMGSAAAHLDPQARLQELLALHAQHEDADNGGAAGLTRLRIRKHCARYELPVPELAKKRPMTTPYEARRKPAPKVKAVPTGAAAAGLRALRSQAVDLLPLLEDLDPAEAKAAQDEMDTLAKVLVLGGELIIRRIA